MIIIHKWISEDLMKISTLTIAFIAMVLVDSNSLHLGRSKITRPKHQQVWQLQRRERLSLQLQAQPNTKKVSWLAKEINRGNVLKVIKCDLKERQKKEYR